MSKRNYNHQKINFKQIPNAKQGEIKRHNNSRRYGVNQMTFDFV